MLEVDLVTVAGSTEKVRSLEGELARDLAELKNEIEENEMVHGIQRAISSVPLPRDGNHFRLEREMVMKRALEVCEARPLIVQADSMQQELDSTTRSDYTPDSIPLLLHQYFLERMHQLVQSKHMHMLRWKRFCEHTSTIEALYPHYQKRLAQIMSEYNDCMARCQRLAIAQESYMSKNNHAVTAVHQDDLLIYLRWLVCHLHAIKKFNQYMRVLQWLPTVHKMDVLPTEVDKHEEEVAPSSRIPAKYQEESSLLVRPQSGAHLSSTHVNSPTLTVTPPKPPPFNPTLLTTTPVPASQQAFAAAASGGGLASDEESLNLPLNVNDRESLQPHLNFFVHLYSVSVDVEKLSSSADEMELYAMASRKFRQIFPRQEHTKTFKTYDKTEVGQENWGADHCMHALKQEANWLPYVSLKAERNPQQQKAMVELCTKNSVDELLRVQSKFMQITDGERVINALREHAVAVRDPLTAQPVNVTSNRTSYHTGAIWKKIYTNPDLYAKKQDGDILAVDDFDDKEADNIDFARRSRSPNARKRKDSYDYMDTMRLLALDDSNQDHNDPASIQGAYLSFLILRHLRIRDLQRTCLSILNYFRSVERTLTINDGGLSLESNKMKRVSPQNHRKSVIDGGLGGSGTLGSHQYLHNTPRDYKIEETAFMEFSDIENHDDFYSMDEGRVHVQDQRGYYIMYDVALEDFRQLEHNLLLVASHYLEKDRDLRGISRVRRSAGRKQSHHSDAGDFSISNYSHQEVDRFGILLDMWSQEAAYMECKKELLDGYLEAYHHVFDRDEKRGLAQVITNVMYERPRFDFSASYFVHCYRMECICLRIRASLTKDILDTQIQEQREYLQRVCREGDTDYGLPYKIIPKQPISVNMSRSALRNVYLLEFHPSLAIASRIPEALKHAYWELYHIHKPKSVTDQILLEKNVLEIARQDWNKMGALGASYSQQVQKDVFSDVFVEDPLFINEIAVSLVDQQEQLVSRKSQKEKQISMITTLGRLLETLTTRYRLLDAAWEAEILSSVYRTRATHMGYDACHLFLRFVQFEFASFREGAGKPPPVFITTIQEDDSSVDRYAPNNLFLGIHELDESHVGRFSFRSRDGVLQILKGQSLESLQTALMCQVVHKNALVAAVQQANACQPIKDPAPLKSNRPMSASETKSEKSSATGLSGINQVTPRAGKHHPGKQGGSSHAAEAFISMQLEKGPCRDVMLNEFVNKKAAMGTILKNPVEMEKLKRKLITEFCFRFNQRVAQYSLRSQIIAYYDSILGLLEAFPNVRDTYFILGEPHEKKSEMDSEKGLESDARTLHKRPRLVLSPDGKHVLDLWFIPHQTELLVLYKRMDDEACRTALTYHLRIVSALHDILQYLCAHSRLGSAHARMGSKKVEFVSADWGGTEGIGADLREIQKQVDHLDDPTSPTQVSQFLTVRRDVMFLEFDVAVRHSMRDTFLTTGNVAAYKAVTECMHFALHMLSNAQVPSVFTTCLNVPEPLEARDADARLLYPWRTFINRSGPYPIHFWTWDQIEYYMQLCLAGLKDVDRHVANGEILGVSLLMEDVLAMGDQNKALSMGSDDEGDGDSATDGMSDHTVSRPSSRLSKLGSRHSSMTSLNRQGSRSSGKKVLSRLERPTEAYQFLRSFLVLWKRLEIFKVHWGKQKLQVENIDSATKFKHFCQEYRKDILYPVLASVARRYGQGELYEGMISDNEALVIPKGASEVEIRLRQLLKLMESTECGMISDVRRRLNKELNLVLSERAREEGALPTDLWKKPTMKESYTINKPHIAEDFIELLMSECKQADSQLSFSKEHLNSCLSFLASEIMAREKHNYDSYSMYYENLLRVQHQLLYQREQEVKQLQDQLSAARLNTEVEVQCQLADRNQDLLLEITALRAKIAEMREYSLTQEQEIRERVRQEYDSLVQNLFSATFDLKRKFDVFREDLNDDVFQKIAEARREAIDVMTRLKQRAGGSIDEEQTRRMIAHAEQVRDIQRENHELTMLLTKVKGLAKWKDNFNKGTYARKIGKLEKTVERGRKHHLEKEMVAKEEVILRRQQIVALRNALRTSEQECGEIKKQLEKELKDKKEKSHEALQRAESMRQLEDARKANVEKLLDNLVEKDSKLRGIEDEQMRTNRLQELMQDKIHKEVTTIKKQLDHERGLKLDAFHRVDELQTQVYDIESGLGLSISRPHTATGASSIRSKSHIGSAKKRSGTSSSGMWPPAVPWPANRSLTPGPEPPNNHEHKRMLRPKTCMGRLRSRIADQLLNDLSPPDHHETLIKLEQLQRMRLEKERMATSSAT